MSNSYFGGVVSKTPLVLNPAAGNAANGVFTMDQYMQAVQGGTWTGIDPYFDQTTLLLHGNGTNGAQNNTFLDSSTNNFTITRNGNTTQGSFSPFSKPDGRWGNYFDGSGDYLNSSITAIGTSDFTVEYWSYLTVHGGTSGENGYFQISATSGGLSTSYSNSVLALRTSGALAVIVNATTINTTFTLPLNTWFHTAIVRSSNSVSVYVNGVLVSTPTTISANLTGTFCAIGGYYSTSFLMTGYLSGFRVVNSAVYTSAFTPPTVPPTAIANTSLLTCQSNRFIDNSSNNFAITVNGNPRVTPFSPFPTLTAYSAATNGGSGYFDGSGDKLQSASNAALALGSNNFSIEWWEYRTAVNEEETPISTGDYSSAYASSLLGYGGTVGGISTTGSSWNVFNFQNYVDPVVAGTWNHFVYTRSGTAFRVFMNGKLSNYTTASGSVVQNNNRWNIGSGGSSALDTTGYIGDTRVCIGSIPTSYQTSSTATGTQIFTSPTGPLTTSSQGATNVVLLCNFTNAGIIDNTMSNNLETVGNAQIDTAVKKFGSGSLEFDGTGDYVTAYNNAGLMAVGSVYTIEMWFYTTTISVAQQSMFTTQITVGDRSYFHIHLDLAQIVVDDGANVNSGPASASGAVSINTWTHLAVVADGSTTKIYLNGVQSGSTFNGLVNPSTVTPYATVGGFGTFNGYIDDFRITKGIARYTSNFTPQTSQWQDQ